MIRVVLDTNILISALLTPQGLPAHVLSRCLSDTDVQLCVSAETDSEYEAVISRPKFKFSPQEANAMLSAVRKRALWITPRNPVKVCPDPDDDLFLECAQEAEAHYLVTGNKRHFPGLWQRTLIVTAREFLDARA